MPRHKEYSALQARRKSRQRAIMQLSMPSNFSHFPSQQLSSCSPLHILWLSKASPMGMTAKLHLCQHIAYTIHLPPRSYLGKMTTYSKLICNKTYHNNIHSLATFIIKFTNGTPINNAPKKQLASNMLPKKKSLTRYRGVHTDIGWK